jgi:acetyltransferase-like isoleucine patch superfamily enzyme
MPAYFASAIDILRARSMILKGVTLSAHVVIGADSVVAKDVPADSFAAGNSARIFVTISNPNLQ